MAHSLAVPLACQEASLDSLHRKFVVTGTETDFGTF